MHGLENMTILFADVLMEDEDLYRFLVDAEKYIGIPITRISEGRDPWQVFEDHNMIGNSRVDMCSKTLKREILWKWIRSNFDEARTVVHIGIDWTESHRIERVRNYQPKWNIQAPMCEPPLWDKCRMIRELEAIGINPPRLYTMGFPHNNCGGFCIKAGHAHFAHLLKTMPERYAYHERREEQMRQRLQKDVSIMKDRRNNEVKPLTMAQLRGRIERNEWYDRTEWGGCGCAIDDGQQEFNL